MASTSLRVSIDPVLLRRAAEFDCHLNAKDRRQLAFKAAESESPNSRLYFPKTEDGRTLDKISFGNGYACGHDRVFGSVGSNFGGPVDFFGLSHIAIDLVRRGAVEYVFATFSPTALRWPIVCLGHCYRETSKRATGSTEHLLLFIIRRTGKGNGQFRTGLRSLIDPNLAALRSGPREKSATYSSLPAIPWRSRSTTSATSRTGFQIHSAA